MREVRAMRALDHPGVVPLRSFVPEGPAIVLAWMAGGTLERLLATTSPLAPARAVEIAAAVRRGPAARRSASRAA